MTHTKVSIPSGFVAPSNPIFIQCRVNPTEIYAKDKIKPSDYIAPQYTLAFTVTTNPAARGIQTKTHNAKRKRDGDVQNIITNFYDIQNRLPDKSLRCLGVTFGSVLDANDAIKHPDSNGRLAVMVSGAVTIVCNQNDLANLHVGDFLTWAPHDNGQVYEGYPNDWSTAKIVRAVPPSITDIDVSFESVFGPKELYDNGPKHVGDLKSQLGVLQTIAPASMLDVTHLAGVTPYAVAETLAHVMFAQDSVKLAHRDEWIEKLYDADSKYYCFETKPAERTSVKWIQHCLGDALGQYYNDGTNGWFDGARLDEYDSATKQLTSRTKVLIATLNTAIPVFDHLPPAVGWFVARTRSKTIDPAKIKELSRIAKMTTLPAQTVFEEYLLYKAIHGEPFTSNDWARFVLGPNTPAASDVGKFTAGIFAGGTTHKRMAAMVFLEQGYMNLIPEPYNDKEDLSCVDLARVGFKFYNVNRAIANNAVLLARTNQTSKATDEMKLAYAKNVMGLHVHAHSQNIFGMLLEKNQRANEARILLKV
jgi:hypothetical protein